MGCDRVILLATASAGFALSILADDFPDARLFAMPPPSLRTSSIPVAKPQTTGTNSVEIVLTSESSYEAAVQRFEALSGGPVLRQPPPHEEPGGAYGAVKGVL